MARVIVIEDPDDELARLEAEIAENDALDDDESRLRAAHALLDKADLLASSEGEAGSLPHYREVARRLDGRADQEARDVRAWALHGVIRALYALDRTDECRTAAESQIEQRFDDPPSDAAADAIARDAILLGELLGDAEEYDAAIAVLDRVVARQEHAPTPDGELVIALAEAKAARVLNAARRSDDAIARCDRLLERLDDNEHDADLRPVHALALVHKSVALEQKGLKAERDVLCLAVVERFAGDEDSDVAECVSWAEETLTHAQDRALVGRQLHGQAGHGAEAEAAYREAIDRGHRDVWLNLGLLLSGVPGRAAEEEAAYRKARDSVHTQTVAWAALEMGNVLQWRHHDFAAARGCYELAAKDGDADIKRVAVLNVAHVAAYCGDRAAARSGFTAFAQAYAELHDLEFNQSFRAAAAWRLLVETGPSRHVVHWLWGLRYRTSRRRRAFIAHSRVTRLFGVIVARIRSEDGETTAPPSAGR